MHHEIIHRGFDLEYGPFSYAAMGGDAVSVICNECLEALFCGEWHWKPKRELSSMLIQIAKSKRQSRALWRRDLESLNKGRL